jgi:hypothetical protein
MKTRHAVSLVELLVVMSACSIILTMSAGLIHRAMHNYAKTREFFDTERSALRLSAQFRRDVNRATAAELDRANLDEGAFLRLEMTEGDTVQYAHHHGGVLRVLLQSSTIMAREEFRISPAAELTLREEGSPSRLILSAITKAARTSTEVNALPADIHRLPVSFEVQACLGRDRQFAGTSARQERPE